MVICQLLKVYVGLCEKNSEPAKMNKALPLHEIPTWRGKQVYDKVE